MFPRMFTATYEPPGLGMLSKLMFSSFSLPAIVLLSIGRIYFSKLVQQPFQWNIVRGFYFEGNSTTSFNLEPSPRITFREHYLIRLLQQFGNYFFNDTGSYSGRFFRFYQVNHQGFYPGVGADAEGYKRIFFNLQFIYGRLLYDLFQVLNAVGRFGS